MPEFDLVILAGGRSVRMGRDKATMQVQGHRLVDLLVERFTPVASQVIVARGDRPLGLVQEVSDDLDDLPEAAGPIAGVIAGLRAAAPGLVALLPVDSPLTSSQLVEHLVGECSSREAGAVVPVVGGRAQPLNAVLHTDMLGSIEANVRSGELSPRRILRIIGAVELGPQVWGQVDPEAAFAQDWDTPQDIQPL